MSFSADCHEGNTSQVPEAMDGARFRLGLVTPLANERSNICGFMDAVLSHLTNEDRWYCVLDNVSQDGTREIVEARAKADPRVVYIWAPQNRCVVDAYFVGYRAAYDAGCSFVLDIDAGFSHPPEKIPEFASLMNDGYDFVASSRFMPGGAHRSPWTRRLLSYGGTLIARTVLHSKMTDMTGGFKCFNRRAMKHLLDHRVQSRANFFQAEIRYMMHRFQWREIPIVYINDQFRVGRSALRDSLRVLARMTLQR